MEVKSDKRPHAWRKLSKELIDSIVKDIAGGCTHVLACESHRITEGIFNAWRNQGKLDLDNEVDSLPAYLVESLARVKKEEVMSCREDIRKSEKGHKGAEWTLEHAYWRQFGQNAAIKEMAKQLDRMENKNG